MTAKTHFWIIHNSKTRRILTHTGNQHNYGLYRLPLAANGPLLVEVKMYRRSLLNLNELPLEVGTQAPPPVCHYGAYEEGCTPDLVVTSTFRFNRVEVPVSRWSRKTLRDKKKQREVKLDSIEQRGKSVLLSCCLMVRLSMLRTSYHTSNHHLPLTGMASAMSQERGARDLVAGPFALAAAQTQFRLKGVESLRFFLCTVPVRITGIGYLNLPDRTLKETKHPNSNRQCASSMFSYFCFFFSKKRTFSISRFLN
ncbi:hypothetical protein HOY80DRAFT_1020335 [Tuber brumale]|nr:hypothetical protein HOY80DRAFT_1020335 [Tuber brumale]